MFTNGEELRNNRYEGISRTGVVVDRRSGKTGPQVRVHYADRGVTSAWLAVGQRNTIGSQDFNLPRLGEQVIVQHLANGPERGVVVGCLFNERVSSPVPDNPDDRQVIFDDGTLVNYDPGAKRMTIVAAGAMDTTAVEINFTASGNVTITAAEIFLKGNVTIENDLHVLGTTYMQQAFADPNCTNADGSGEGS
jgi:phage baseplate assembly protein V